MQYQLKKEVIKEALKSKNMKYVDLMMTMIENGYDVAEISLKKWLQPKGTMRPSIENINAIAQALDLKFSDIVEMDETASVVFNVSDKMGVKKVAVVACASCGAPELSVYDCDDEVVYYPENLWNERVFAVKACGDSMSPEIDDGDLLVCDEQEPIKNGDLVYYTLFNDKAVKIYYKDKQGNIKLIPRNQNPAFMTINIMSNDDALLDNFKATKVVRITKANINNRSARLRAVGLKND
ncbi:MULTISPECIES: LexA family protein [unclassified Campylobacter]|uniref:LexA family protein n=1 Tax=unclassified Campylobacter TaxID=2593542 RepID=UPI003D33AB88